MSPLKVIVGTVNSHPVGTADDDIEQVYQTAYRPFLRTLYAAPAIRATLFFSGALLEWLQRHHSEYTDVLTELVQRRQVELLGGGFYDPAFPIIPVSDRLGQIELLTTTIRKCFGRRPRGGWVTASIWEPTMASVFRNAGFDYCFLPDRFFQRAGLSRRDRAFPCMTEDQGKTVVAFPVAGALSQQLVDEPVADFVQNLVETPVLGDDQVVAVFADGGCLGGTPEAFERWYDAGRLQALFERLNAERRAGRLELVLPGRHVRRTTPRRRAYFFADADTGGSFRETLARYPDANLMYAKMYYIHALVNQIRGDKYRKQAAREELWKGQCNTAYWHGAAAGIYRSRFRRSVYTALIEAEKITRERGVFIASVIALDFDMDGLPEQLFQGLEMNAYVHQRGALVFEVDYLAAAWNYCDTAARLPEPYHQPNSQVYDAYPRKWFVDHLLPADVALTGAVRAELGGVGSLVEAVYELVGYKREHHELEFQFAGPVLLNGAEHRVQLSKSYCFCKTTIEVVYRLTNCDSRPLAATFAGELNLSFASDCIHDLRLRAVAGGDRTERGAEITPACQEIASAQQIVFDDLHNRSQVSVVAGGPVRWWSFPVVAEFQAFGEAAADYQASCLLALFPVDLAVDQTGEYRLQVAIAKLKAGR